jgi:alcohol dehydrogenase (cytochrome c)
MTKMTYGLCTGLAVVGLTIAPIAPAAAQENGGIYTEEQARQGKQLYDAQCSLCHGPREFAEDVFKGRWFGQPARNLFLHILDTMPQDAPGSLKPEQAAAMVAYILELNKEPAGEKPIPTDIEALGELRLPPPPLPER